MSTVYRVNTARQPSQEIVLEKSTIFLGVNGSGKSAALNYAAFRLSHDMKEKVVYIQGGRSIPLNENLGFRQHQAEMLTLDQVERQYDDKRASFFNHRIDNVFQVMIRRGEKIWREHSKAIHSWHERKNGHPPNRPELPLEKLFNLFSEVFPSITLEFNEDERKFICSKNGSQKYSISGLSDGEKQVLLSLAEIAVLKHPGGLVIVDEPELNLHGSLASTLWDLLEAECEDTVFVYATHSIGFCMRENVKRIYVMDESSSTIQELSGIEDLNESQLRSFLGMIPAILSSTRILLTEGKADSFDPIFYRWITGEKSLQIVPMGGCADVVAIADRQQFWNQVSSTVSIVGVIDRDFLPNPQLESRNAANTIVLDLHESESYVCVPSVVIDIARELGLVPVDNIESRIENSIVNHFRENFISILAHRVRHRTKFDMGEVTIAKSILSNISDSQELRAAFLEEALTQQQYASNNLDSREIAKHD